MCAARHLAGLSRQASRRFLRVGVCKKDARGPVGRPKPPLRAGRPWPGGHSQESEPRLAPPGHTPK